MFPEFRISLDTIRTAADPKTIENLFSQTKTIDNHFNFNFSFPEGQFSLVNDTAADTKTIENPVSQNKTIENHFNFKFSFPGNA